MRQENRLITGKNYPLYEEIPQSETLDLNDKYDFIFLYRD